MMTDSHLSLYTSIHVTYTNARTYSYKPPYSCQNQETNTELSLPSNSHTHSSLSSCPSDALYNQKSYFFFFFSGPGHDLGQWVAFGSHVYLFFNTNQFFTLFFVFHDLDTFEAYRKFVLTNVPQVFWGFQVRRFGQEHHSNDGVSSSLYQIRKQMSVCPITGNVTLVIWTRWSQPSSPLEIYIFFLCINTYLFWWFVEMFVNLLFLIRLPHTSFTFDDFCLSLLLGWLLNGGFLLLSLLLHLLVSILLQGRAVPSPPCMFAYVCWCVLPA